jgi:hypothetical protein
MAEVEIQRKTPGASPLTWLIALVVLGVLGWWAYTTIGMGRDRSAVSPTPYAMTSPTAGTASPDGPVAATPNLPLAAMRANPDAYFGKEISGLATVAEVMGTRAFIIEQDGTRVYVVTDAAIGEASGMGVGKQVSLTGTVVNPDEMQQRLSNINELETTTLKALQGEPALIHATNLEMQNT